MSPASTAGVSEGPTGSGEHPKARMASEISSQLQSPAYSPATFFHQLTAEPPTLLPSQGQGAGSKEGFRRRQQKQALALLF